MMIATSIGVLIWLASSAIMMTLWEEFAVTLTGMLSMMALLIALGCISMSVVIRRLRCEDEDKQNLRGLVIGDGEYVYVIRVVYNALCECAAEIGD